ncbi:hypothetical protein L2D01_06695 [Hyphomonadaceae bacterium ML37]|nr:hypothetical protein L2D01_06695 [Hyphomonadaceae bacterium ML37]
MRQLNFLSENAVPELAELSATESQGGQDDLIPLNVELLFGPAQIITERSVFRIALKKAYIRIISAGGTIVSSSRYANDQKQQVVEVETTDTAALQKGSDFSVQGTLALPAPAQPLPASISSNFGSKRIARRQTEENYRKIIERVRALPGSRWIIQETRGGFLEGRYLGVDNICDIKCDRDLVDLEITLFFDVKDITIIGCHKVTGSTPKPINDKSIIAVSEALIKQALARNGAEITISEARIDKGA